MLCLRIERVHSRRRSIQTLFLRNFSNNSKSRNGIPPTSKTASSWDQASFEQKYLNQVPKPPKSVLENISLRGSPQSKQLKAQEKSTAWILETLTGSSPSSYPHDTVVNKAIRRLYDSLAKRDFKSKHITSILIDQSLAYDKLKSLEERIVEELTKEAHKNQEDQDNKSSLEDFFTPTIKKLNSTLTKISQHKFPEILARKHNVNNFDEQVNYIFEQLFASELISILSTEIPAPKLSLDISNPPEWFPRARKTRRKIIMHVGPTNSGKTYNALNRLRAAKSGYFAGPLRLLAREVYERFQDEGLRCNLVTGEEIIEDIDQFGNPATISSGTIEMIDLNAEFDVVVLDEIQMIADENRGWAWTQALLGVNAKEIHLCGEASSVKLITKIAESNNDEVVVNEYQRLGTLEVEQRPITVADLKKGDCVVAFSKNKILEYKTEIQAKTGLKCGVIYGALPPDTRSAEALKFNTGEYDVLVASDAIGMGLNLKINRVVFHTASKFDGKANVTLTDSQIKQIAGRAGRFKVHDPSKKKDDTASPNLPDAIIDTDPSIGYVTAFNFVTLNTVRRGLAQPIEYLQQATMWPPDNIWASYISEFPEKTPLFDVWRTFAKDYQTTELYKLVNLEPRLEIAQLLTKIDGLSVGDQLLLSNAPVSSRGKDIVEDAYVAFTTTIKNSDTTAISDYKSILPFDVLDLEQNESDEDRLSTYEELYKAMLLFMWLNNRYPTYFIDRESVTQLTDLCEERICTELKNLKQKKILGYRTRR